jgi:hypothetical protein
MQKKYIIALSVVVLILIGFIGYRHSKKTAAFDEEQKKTDSMMVAMAQTIPTGGMTQMAAALKRYEEDNGRFPFSLQDLYPKYIYSKAFIEEIDWEYEAEGNHFSLKKRFTKNNTQMVASVDKNLKPRIEKSTLMAAARRVPKTLVSRAPDTGGISQTPLSGKRLASLAKGRHMQDFPNKPVAAESGHLEEEETEFTSSPIPEPFTIVDVEACTGFPVEASQRHLVWKRESGIMGFGNVDYPDAGRLTICENGQWVDIERVRQEPEESPAGLEPRRTFFGVMIR